MKTARIAETATEYVLSDDSLDYIQEGGRAWPSRRAAIRWARESRDGWTHYIDAGGRRRPIKGGADV